MPFITPDFMLSNEHSRRLYHEHAAGQPIFDYHCHLPPADVADNRSFKNLFEIWLEGDHYKWRAMRANGVDETYCTGDADPYDKFLAWARTVPHTLRNPLYHWSHLELQRYFDIDLPINQDTAPEIWEEANRNLPDLNVATIMDRFNVALIGTTDMPADDLQHHKQLAESQTLPDTAVYPAFRPDKVHDFSDMDAWNRTIDAIGEAAAVKINRFDDLLDALNKRHAFFHDAGARLSDHGLTHLPLASCSEENARDIFDRARGNADGDREDLPPHDGDEERFRSFMLLFFAKLDHAAGWTHQLHLGAMRNNNAWASQHLGPDTGFDSIGDFPQGPGLRRHLGTLAGDQTLPKTILYTLNPRDNYLFATMIGNYQGGPPGSPGEPGKVQFGSGWWFLDQLEGMTWQINALSNLGLLSRFVGMLTDSRSFLSYPRHEYFRRLLCDMIGRDIAAGLIPDDPQLVGTMIENICFNNAKNYFGMQLRGKHA